MDRKPVLNIPKEKSIVYRTNKKSRRIDLIMLENAVSDIETATHLGKEEIERRLLSGHRLEDAWSTFVIKRA